MAHGSRAPVPLCRAAACLAALVSLSLTALSAQTQSSQTPPGQTPPGTPDIGKAYVAPRAGDDYERREVMIPMRDGVKLFTVIVVPKGASRAPMIMTRTPYNAGRRAARNASPHMLATLPQGDEVFVADGYIRVFQDVRGKYGSEGDYVLTRPLRGPLNPTPTDHSTDAYDTIEWLVKNVPESNGRVGMLGSSYEGFTVVMALVNPHPALKVAAPMSPMVDGWMGDDWFHYGAFRLPSLDFIAGQTSVRGAGEGMRRGEYDDYEMLPAGRFGRRVREGARPRAVRRLAEAERAPGLRRVLAGPGSGPGDGRSSRCPCRRCGSRACGIRKTCGAPSRPG